LLPASALLPNRDGHAMTRTNVAQRLALAVAAATRRCRACDAPHLPAHHPPHDGHASAAVRRAIERHRLWLGHESPTTTHQYTEADLAMKEKALARLQDPDTASRRFRAS
jgi:integrase/recombinase XerD